MHPEPFNIYKRYLPHWRQTGSVYFVTFRCITTPLKEAEIKIVSSHILSGHKKFYLLFAAVVMPDHAHALLQPNEGIELARAMKGIKGVSARKINQSRGTSGHVWQDEYWDRIVRDDNELQEKMHYMFNNPIKKGLCADTSHWCGWVIPEN